MHRRYSHMNHTFKKILKGFDWLKICKKVFEAYLNGLSTDAGRCHGYHYSSTLKNRYNLRLLRIKRLYS